MQADAMGHKKIVPIERCLIIKAIYITNRITWILLISIAGIGIVFLSYLLQIRYFSNRMATVVESTFFPIYDIPFPAVTICNYNRVNGERIDEAIEMFLPNASAENIEKLRKIVVSLNTFEFGSFNAFKVIYNDNLLDLEDIDLTSLYRHVSGRD